MVESIGARNFLNSGMEESSSEERENNARKRVQGVKSLQTVAFGEDSELEEMGKDASPELH